MNYATEHHWLDLPEADEDQEGPVPERKPICAFAKKQTLLIEVLCPYPLRKLMEFPIAGDEHYLGSPFWEDGVRVAGRVYAYILNRHSEFQHKFSSWALER